MAITQDQVVEHIKNLRLSDVKGLIEVLEQELGVGHPHHDGWWVRPCCRWWWRSR